jgi:hypothetical protein
MSRAGNGFAREYGGAAGVCADIRASVAAVYDRRNAKLSVIPDREGGANIHGLLRSGCFLWRFGLFKEMNSSFVAVIRQKIRCFFETKTAQCTARVHVPRSCRVFWLSA